MYVIPYEIITVVIKTLKLTCVLNGINVNPCTRITKKGLRQQKAPVGGHRFTWLLQILFCKMCEIPAARVTRRGPSRSTIIIL